MSLLYCGPPSAYQPLFVCQQQRWTHRSHLLFPLLLPTPTAQWLSPARTSASEYADAAGSNAKGAKAAVRQPGQAVGYCQLPARFHRVCARIGSLQHQQTMPQASNQPAKGCCASQMTT